MQQTSVVPDYPRIHAPVQPLTNKKACEFEDADVIAGLKKIYTGQIDPEICLNMTALDDYRQAVELALLLHVRRGGTGDDKVILRDEVRLARARVRDFVGIFTALYNAARRGDCTNDEAWKIVAGQIALRKSALTESEFHRMVRQMNIFKGVPATDPKKGRIEYLKVMKPMTLTQDEIYKTFGELLPQNIYITGDHMYAAYKAYQEVLKTIA